MLPNTLSGLAGFMIFVVVILGMTAPDLFPSEVEDIQNTQEDMRQTATHMTNTTSGEPSAVSDLLGLAGLDGIYNFITNYLYLMGQFIVLFFQYVAMFMGISLMIPTEFYVFFAIIGMSTIISIVKLIFLAGD